MLKRIVTGVVALAITLGCLLWREPWGAWGLIAIVSVIGSIEVSRLTRTSPAWAVVAFGLCAYGLISTLPSVFGVFLVALFILSVGSILLWRPNHYLYSPGLYVWLATGCFGAFGLTFVREIGDQSGWAVGLFLAMLPLWVGDSLAYFIGSKFGKHKMAASLSPNKSWEGAIANFLGCLVASWFAVRFMAGSHELGIALGLTTGVFGQIGDLLQSRVKRLSGVKDSGSILPGHGGILDRMDSFLFSAIPTLLAIVYIDPTLFHVKQWSL